MKSAALLLIASLAVNAALVVMLYPTIGRNSADVSPSPSVSPAMSAHTPAARAGVIASRPPEKIWRRLETRDLPVLVAQLRRAGFPPAMIRAVVVVLAEAQCRTRERELLHPSAQVRPSQQLPESLQMTITMKLEEERDALITRLLGPRWRVDDDAFRIEIAGNFGALSPEKMVRIHEIMTSFHIAAHEAIAPIQTKDSEVIIGLPDSFEDLEPSEMFPPEIVAKLKLLDAEKRARLDALLTPAEREEHELRTHPSAAQLRHDLGEFEPTEAEFRALFAVRRDFDADFRPYSETTASARLASDAWLQSQFASALGPVRYAEYLQVTDPASAQFNRLVARLNLPISAAMEVTALKREATERANTIRANPALRSEQRNAQLATLADDAVGKATAILGARGIEAYHRYGGYWLDLIQPSQLASPPASTPSP